MVNNQDEEANLFSTLNSRDNKLSECEKELGEWENAIANMLNPLLLSIPLMIREDVPPLSYTEAREAMEYFNKSLSDAMNRVLNNEQT